MKVIFLQDYTGRETGMLERKKGESLDISIAQALELIRLGVVEEVIEETEPVVTQQPKRKARGDQ